MGYMKALAIDAMNAAADGAAYRVKAQHPRREGPLRITAADGTVIAESGQTCEHVSAEHLASMIANGYVEPIDLPVASTKEAASE